MLIHLSHQSAYDLLSTLLCGSLSDSETGNIFLELVSRPISSQVLLDCVKVLREKMLPVVLSSPAIDTAGTGGSGLKTINTSTLTAFIVAAAGGKVAKHGSRSQTGNCGCFDLLDALHIRTNLSVQQEQEIFDELSIVFLFAYQHHPALGFVAPLRKKYGKKTLFNLIGPLCNPAGVHRQMIGTGNEADAEIIAETLHGLGSLGSLVVTGHDGLDEVTITAGTTLRHVLEKCVEVEEFSPQSLSVSLAISSEIVGGNSKDNSAHFLELAQGKGTTAMRNLILLNAAHAMLLTPLATTTREAFSVAQEALDSGAAYNLFRSYRDLSHRL